MEDIAGNNAVKHYSAGLANDGDPDFLTGSA